MSSTSGRAKRGLDLLLGGLLLAASLPVQGVVAILVRLSSPGPILHRATRVGTGGSAFTLYKFRSMRVGAAQAGPGITAADDPRTTSIGRFLRRTHLDELPQLFNVIRGQMSLVGPRPEDPRFVALYDEEQRAILLVRPGITGPTQLRFRHEERMLVGPDPEAIYVRELLPQKLAIDLEYVRHHTLLGDLRILVRTVTVLFA